MTFAYGIRFEPAIPAPDYFAAAIKSICGSSPGIHSGNTDAKAVGLIRYHALNILRPPVVNSLTLAVSAIFLSMDIQMLHHNRECSVDNGGIDNKLSCKDRNPIIDSLHLCPQSRGLAIAVLLRFLNPVKRMRQGIFFFGKRKESSSRNSAVRSHCRAYTCAFYSKVRRRNNLLCQRDIMQRDFLLKRERKHPVFVLPP